MLTKRIVLIDNYAGSPIQLIRQKTSFLISRLRRQRSIDVYRFKKNILGNEIQPYRRLNPISDQQRIRKGKEGHQLGAVQQFCGQKDIKEKQLHVIHVIHLAFA